MSGFPNNFTKTWLKLEDGGLVTVDASIVDTNNRIVIDKATFNDSGLYICQADNGIGNATREFNITGKLWLM